MRVEDTQTMVRYLIILTIVSVGGSLSSVPLEGQETHPVPQTRWEKSTHQRPGTVFGAVYDVESGLPLRGAVVILGDEGEGAVTDSLGRFRFRARSCRQQELCRQYFPWSP